MNPLLRASVHSVLALTHDMFSIRRPVELARNSVVYTVMCCLFSDMLPGDFASGNAQMWDLAVVVRAINALGRLAGSTVSSYLHRPMLLFWPYLIAETRRLAKNAEGSPSGPKALKVRRARSHIQSGHIHCFCMIVLHIISQ